MHLKTHPWHFKALIVTVCLAALVVIIALQFQIQHYQKLVVTYQQQTLVNQSQGKNRSILILNKEDQIIGYVKR